MGKLSFSLLTMPNSTWQGLYIVDVCMVHEEDNIYNTRDLQAVKHEAYYDVGRYYVGRLDTGIPPYPGKY